MADLGGAPVLVRTLQALEQTPEIAKIVVASPDAGTVRALADAHHITKLAAVVPGGKTRADSVRAALAAVPKETKLVAVHDAARPLASPALIGRIVRCAGRTGAVIPAVPVKDTVKVVREGCVQSTPDRASLFAAQTPQVFSKLILETALSLPGSFTDDASAVEAMGVCVRTLAGDYENLKITTPEDLVIARLLYERRPPCESATATTSTV